MRETQTVTMSRRMKSMVNESTTVHGGLGLSENDRCNHVIKLFHDIISRQTLSLLSFSQTTTMPEELDVKSFFIDIVKANCKPATM
jgi:hypothetical protein